MMAAPIAVPGFPVTLVGPVGGVLVAATLDVVVASIDVVGTPPSGLVGPGQSQDIQVVVTRGGQSVANWTVTSSDPTIATVIPIPPSAPTGIRITGVKPGTCQMVFS